jgi:sialate O-acetylesterase
MCKKLVVLTFFVFVFGLAGTAAASVTLPAIIGDNMVLQQGMDVPIWGTANSGEQVTVDFDGQSKSDIADGNGDWMVTLNPMSASLSGADMVITGDNVITLTDVWVGEVWVSSGQSNMNMSLGSGVYGADEAIADMVNHNIRRFKVDSAEWVLLTPSNGNQASAVHYFFAHELAHNLGNIAGGMIETAVSGSGIEEWTHTNGCAGLLYEGRINPLQPYAIQGAIWYQGETDFNWKSEFYYDRMVGLIGEWRTDWGQGDFPFGIVQLPWKTTHVELWPVVQDSQLRAHLDVGNTGLAVTWDLDPKGKGVHPYTKKPIGERLALWARSQVYSQSGFEYSGPIRDAQQSYVNGNEIVIAFDHIGAGLTTNQGGDPYPFKVAGSDGTYYDATGQIVGDTVVVSSPSVSEPVSVRFVWDYSQGDLFNVDGLPATVFEMNLSGGSYCGDGTCDPGEDQCNCPDDCGMPPSTETSCTDGIDNDCDTYVDCDDSDCLGDPACPYCGDGTCDEDEDQCNCPEDCGTPPSTETSCTDGIDNDCDTYTDCDDSDCDGDPACPDCLPKNAPCTDNADCCSGNCRPSGKCA